MENVFRINRPCGDRNNSGLYSGAYPMQLEKYIGRTIMVRYRDQNETGNIVCERNDPYAIPKPVFKVLRWDYDSKGKVILTNKRNQVIITTVDEINTHKWYKKTRYDDIVFMLPDDIRESITEEEYNELYYSKEKIYAIGKDSKHVHTGELVLIEFENDRYGLISREHFNPPTLDYKKIAENVIASYPERENWPLEILRSFDSYFNEHRHSELDIPMRYTKSGVLIKDDKYNTVVRTYDPETGEAQYLVDDEANFYLCWKFDDEVYEKLGGEINLWL